jgi:DNA-directed RNA polymerase specialized sigma24 family protein
MTELESHIIPNFHNRLMAARFSVRLAQGEVDEYFNPNTPPERRQDLHDSLFEELSEPFEELGYLIGGREGDDRATDLLGDLLMGSVKYDPCKAKLLPFVEKVLRNKGVDDHRRRTRRQEKAQAGYEEKLAEVTYSNNLLEFSENFPLVETIEKEIPNLRLQADKVMCRALLDHFKEHREIPSNLQICKATGYKPAHVSTRLTIVKRHLKDAVLTKSKATEGVDIDTLHLPA